MSAIYQVQCHSVAAQPHLLTTCSISQCHTGWCCFASLKVCGVAALPWSAWAHVFTPMTQHDTLLPGGCLGTLVCMSDATWTYRHACFCNCLSLECHVATRTYTLETTVYQNYYDSFHTCSHPCHFGPHLSAPRCAPAPPHGGTTMPVCIPAVVQHCK